MAPRTHDLLPLPVNGEVGGVEALAGPRLPLGIHTGRTVQLDPPFVLCGNELLGLDITAVDHVHRGQEILGVQSLMHREHHFMIQGGSRRRFDMGNEVGAVLLTAFRQVDRVANPRRAASFGRAGLRIVGRGDEELRGGMPSCSAVRQRSVCGAT